MKRIIFDGIFLTPDSNFITDFLQFAKDRNVVFKGRTLQYDDSEYEFNYVDDFSY